MIFFQKMETPRPNLQETVNTQLGQSFILDDDVCFFKLIFSVGAALGLLNSRVSVSSFIYLFHIEAHRSFVYGFVRVVHRPPCLCFCWKLKFLLAKLQFSNPL